MRGEGPSGFLIPACDQDGCIVGRQVRANDGRVGKCRWRWTASDDPGRLSLKPVTGVFLHTRFPIDTSHGVGGVQITRDKVLDYSSR